MEKRTKRIVGLAIYFTSLTVIYYIPSIQQEIMRFEKNEILTFGPICLVFGPIILTILSQFLLNIYEKWNLKIEGKIKHISKKYMKLLEINKKYEFNPIKNINRTIYENEYSHKAFDRARAADIILYNIENDQDNLRTDILNAFRNKKIYDIYLKEVKKINEKDFENNIKEFKLSKKTFDQFEKRVFQKEMISRAVYDIKVYVNIEYITPAGKYRYKKERVIGYQELCDLYMKWRNGKKYNETIKRERSYMSDSLRYDVLKRDNFKCKICGSTSKDGAKLHVDHIIPVSKGGKTTLSNLQTLCERCNKGKSNK